MLLDRGARLQNCRCLSTCCLHNALPSPFPQTSLACQTCPRERIHQIPDRHREAPGHLAHQRAEDPAAHFGAVAAEPQAAGARLAADGWLRPSRGAGAPHPGSRPQLQGQGTSSQRIVLPQKADFCPRHSPRLGIERRKCFTHVLGASPRGCTAASRAGSDGEGALCRRLGGGEIPLRVTLP